MKKIIFVILLTLVLLFSSSCSHSESISLAICGSFGVPGMICFDLKRNRYTPNTLEVDNQGRILFEYTAKNIISDVEDTVLVICQKYDSDYVYFYEDKCFIDNDCSDEELDTFKANNDWDEKLDYEAMSRRSNKTSLDLCIIIDLDEISYTDFKSAFCEEFNIDSSEITGSGLIDADTTGQELWVVDTLINEEAATYIVLCDTDLNISSMQVEDEICFEDISVFKIANGWNYGY